MTLREGQQARGVFRRAARKDGARRHHIAPDQREGALRLPKNFLKKRKDAEERIFCGAVSQQARASIPADRTALRPHRHGGGTPTRFFCAENPNRLTCFSQRPARGAVVRRSPAFMTLEREATPTAYFFRRSRLGVTKKPPYAVAAIRRVCSPSFFME